MGDDPATRVSIVVIDPNGVRERNSAPEIHLGAAPRLEGFRLGSSEDESSGGSPPSRRSRSHSLTSINSLASLGSASTDGIPVGGAGGKLHRHHVSSQQNKRSKGAEIVRGGRFKGEGHPPYQATSEKRVMRGVEHQLKAASVGTRDQRSLSDSCLQKHDEENEDDLVDDLEDDHPLSTPLVEDDLLHVPKNQSNRLSVSHDQLNDLEVVLKGEYIHKGRRQLLKEKIKHKFLDVFHHNHSDSNRRSRTRSASGEVVDIGGGGSENITRHRSPSDSKVGKFFSRLRSMSHSDLFDDQRIDRSPSISSLGENFINEAVNPHPQVKDHHKHDHHLARLAKKWEKRRWSSSQESSGVVLQVPGETTTDEPTPPNGFNCHNGHFAPEIGGRRSSDSLSKNNTHLFLPSAANMKSPPHTKLALSRSRSNSDSHIAMKPKAKRKKGFAVDRKLFDKLMRRARKHKRPDEGNEGGGTWEEEEKVEKEEVEEDKGRGEKKGRYRKQGVGGGGGGGGGRVREEKRGWKKKVNKQMRRGSLPAIWHSSEEDEEEEEVEDEELLGKRKERREVGEGEGLEEKEEEEEGRDHVTRGTTQPRPPLWLPEEDDDDFHGDGENEDEDEEEREKRRRRRQRKISDRSLSLHNLSDFREDHFAFRSSSTSSLGSSCSSSESSEDDVDAAGGAKEAEEEEEGLSKVEKARRRHMRRGRRRIRRTTVGNGDEVHAVPRRTRFSIENIWNVFRGRRLSHDVGAAGRHVTDAVVPWLRGKSRSVDHSLHTPFHLEALRRKIGDRTASEPAREMPPSPSDGVEARKENISPADSPGKMGVKTTQDPATTTYTVRSTDTLTSIAARFDTTPSELSKLNRLATRFLFPGQILVVPDKPSQTPELSQDSTQTSLDAKNGHDASDVTTGPADATADSGPGGRTLSPVPPGEGRTPLSPHNFPRTPANSLDTDRALDRECLEKFLKINVRHITDGQGVVAGVLLVTPNAVMFDPNVSDTLVIEHGPESYGVIAPMEYVVNAALYFDIAHMRVKDTQLPKPDMPKPEIYYGPSRGEVERLGSQESPGKDLSLSKDTTFPELASQDDNSSSCSCGGDTRESSAFPKAFEHELLTPIGSDVSPAENNQGQPSPGREVLCVGGELTPIAEATKSEDPATSSTATTTTQSRDPSIATTTTTTSVSSSSKAVTCTTSSTSSASSSSTTTTSTSTSTTLLAQTHCDISIAQDNAQSDHHTSTTAQPQPTPQQQQQQQQQQQPPNDKKRTTSVTFDLSGEGDELMTSSPAAMTTSVGEDTTPESRKQKWISQSRLWKTEIRLLRPQPPTQPPLHQHLSTNALFAGVSNVAKPAQVLKRLSYPLSWMESFSADKDQLQHQQQYQQPSSAPAAGVTSVSGGTATTGMGEDQKSGMFSNVFNMSNVSSMLSSSPKYLVDFSSGLFARSPSDAHSSVRDISELGTPPGSLDTYRKILHSQSVGGGAGEGGGGGVGIVDSEVGSLQHHERKGGIPIGQPGRPSLDFARRPAANLTSSIVSTGATIVNSGANIVSSGANMVVNTAGVAMEAATNTTGNQGGHSQTQSQPQTQTQPQSQPQPQQQQQQQQQQQSEKQLQFKEGPRFGLKSMVSVDDMPELFASFDILAPHFPSLHQLELIPKPAQACDDPPLYLCLRMGKPVGKKIPKSTPIMSYGKRRMRPEYWFSIPRHRTDDLYHFFQLWAPDVYGELNEEEVVARDFLLAEDDADLPEEDDEEDDVHEGRAGDLSDITKESWDEPERLNPVAREYQHPVAQRPRQIPLVHKPHTSCLIQKPRLDDVARKHYINPVAQTQRQNPASVKKHDMNPVAQTQQKIPLGRTQQENPVSQNQHQNLVPHKDNLNPMTHMEHYLSPLSQMMDHILNPFHPFQKEPQNSVAHKDSQSTLAHQVPPSPVAHMEDHSTVSQLLQHLHPLAHMMGQLLPPSQALPANSPTVAPAKEPTSPSPQVVSMSEDLRQALYSSASLNSLELEAFLPDIIGTSEIITDHVRKSMYRKLPARAQGYAWKLMFSTSQHGFSLKSLYRKMADIDSPVMIFIQDTNQSVFGAVMSCAPKVSDLFYGTGESFLFTFQPDLQTYLWTGENTFFMKGNNESLVIGGGDGNFGLWLDGDLYQGRTQPCKTFNNPPLTSEDFIIKAVECWAFE
ncbi:TLD domain-containing protein mustard isoform X5 [Oratosquilla oratoria]|uniref:TLD domain-containing protein mustard isoform X5 n=1 Tax=Oratosquilla oratoria TaxID=337810 RepID=UPI003F75F870